MEYKKFTFNPFQENTYVVWDKTKECILIDPGCYYPNEFKELKDFIEKQGLIPKYILNTHCHIDHVLGVQEFKELYKIEFVSHQYEQLNLDRLTFQANMFGLKLKSSTPVIDKYLKEGDLFAFGNSQMEVIFVPGHSPGHLAFYSKENNLLIAGDVLFYESIGRTDLPGCNHSDLLKSIKEKLFFLPDNTIVLAGHMQNTTIGHEKKYNPFLTN